jgi:hypothetical protein
MNIVRVQTTETDRALRDAMLTLWQAAERREWRAALRYALRGFSRWS